MSYPENKSPQMESRAASPFSWFVAGLSLALCVLTLLFEPLFLDRSLLGFDNRNLGPFWFHLDDAERVAEAGNFETSDINAWILPETMLQLKSLKEGRAPLWNPHMNLGQPLLANLGFAPYYPTSILYGVLDTMRAYAWSMALHLFFLGLGALLFFRNRGRGPLCAFFGAMIVMLSGFITVHLHLPHFVRVASWFPWSLLCASAMISSPSRRRIALLGLVIGLSLLAGFPQLAMIQFYALSAYFLVQVWGKGIRPYFAAAISVFIGALISCIHLLPAKELLENSWRKGGVSQESMMRKSLEPESLLGWVMPHLFGDPVLEKVTGPTPPPRDIQDVLTYERWFVRDIQNNFVENTIYLGWIPLVLAMLFGLPTRKSWSRDDWFFLGLGIASLAIALGTPLFAELNRLLPGAGAGSPKRWLFLTTCSLGWFSVRGLSRLSEACSVSMSRRWWMGTLFASLIAFACLSDVLWSAIFDDASPQDIQVLMEVLHKDGIIALIASIAFLVLGLRSLVLKKSNSASVGLSRLYLIPICMLTACDLVSLGRSTNPDQPFHEQYDSTPIVKWLQRNLVDGSRMMTFPDQSVFTPMAAEIFGLSSLNGTAALVDLETGELFRALDPTMLDPEDPRVVGSLSELRAATELDHPLLDRLAVRYVVCAKELPEIPGPLVFDGQSLGEQLGIFERSSALPFVSFVESLRVEADKERRLAYLGSSEYNPWKEAVLSRSLDDHPMEGLSLGTVQWHRPSPERIELKVQIDSPGFLVIAESHFPGWQVRVDGELVGIEVVDHALMGLPLNDGSHEISFEYAPWSFTVGTLATLLGLALCGTLLVSRRPKRPQEDTDTSAPPAHL